MTRSAEWVDLPSGSFLDIDGVHFGYVFGSCQGVGYWWITRHGKTIIEGPGTDFKSSMGQIYKVYDDFLAHKSNVIPINGENPLSE